MKTIHIGTKVHIDAHARQCCVAVSVVVGMARWVVPVVGMARWVVPVGVN